MRTLFFILLLMNVSATQAAEFAVVVAKDSSINNLDAEALREIFLRRRNFEADLRLVPVNVLGDTPVRVEFENRILQMDRESLSRYWVSNHFQGIKPPATQASLQSVKAFVIRVVGAMGYLPMDMVDDSLKVIHEF